MLAWLSVWSEVQMICIWSSRCHCHPIISCFIKFQIGLTFLLPAYPGCTGKETIKWVPVNIKTGHLEDVLPSQSLGLVMKKLNLTEEKQRTQKQNSFKPPHMQTKINAALTFLAAFISVIADKLMSCSKRNAAV